MCSNTISNTKQTIWGYLLWLEKLTVFFFLFFSNTVCYSATSHAGGWVLSACLGGRMPQLLTSGQTWPRFGSAGQSNKSQSLAIGVNLGWPCYDTIARLPSTRAALVVKIQWVINICHHLEGLVTNYYSLEYGKESGTGLCDANLKLLLL